MTETTSPRGVGRPRKEETTANVLGIVRNLVRERGYEAVSVNLVASEAGVAKQTLYRRWPGKAEIVLDAFLESASKADGLIYAGLEATLAKYLRGLFRHLESDGPAIRNLIASAQADADFLQRFRSRFVEPRAAHLRAILQSAVDAGDLSPVTDLNVLTDMVHGAFWYRLLTGKALDSAYAGALAKQVSRAVKE
jgi:AcrR family transcriptional regulator